MRYADRRPSPAGFALVELLVVVGIIAIVIALVFPLLRRLREQAWRVQCTSNLRQILQANLSYVADNDGFLPQANYVLGPPDAGWLYKPPLGSPSDDSLVETGVLWPYVKNRAVYRCPMVAGPYVSGPSQALTSYMMNMAVIAYGARTYSFASRLMPERAILFWESGEDEPGYSNPSSWNDGCSFPPEGLTKRHADGAQVGTVGGSVEWISSSQFQQELNDSPGRFWCDPDRADGH